MQFSEQYSHAGTIRMVDSTTKNDPITPWLHRASEADSTLGSHVSEMVGEVVIGTPKPIASQCDAFGNVCVLKEKMCDP